MAKRTPATAPVSTPRRASKRIKESSGTPTARRSRYFDRSRSGSESSGGSRSSGSPSLASPSPSADEGDEYGEDEKDDHDDDDEEEEEVNDRGETVIRLPRPRSPGGTEYSPDTIHPNTFLFLRDLGRHNRREWLKMHDADFRASERDFDSFVATLSAGLIEHDETIPELPVKDIKFRIYRDIRFSPDPTPYKAYFSAAWSRTGRKGPYAAYYLQLAPGKSFIGGGLWHPDARPLALLRQNIDAHPEQIRAVLHEEGVRQFLTQTKGAKADPVAAFIGHNADSALKTKPKGYDALHPALPLLRLRNYTIGRPLRDADVLGADGAPRVLALLAALTPFVAYLNGVVMPD